MVDVDFRVEIGPPGADGYPVVFRTTDGVETSGTLRLPPSHELEALAARVPDAVIASSAQVRRAVAEGEAPVRELGRLLFDALLEDDGKTFLLTTRNRAARQGGQVRMVFRVQPPELARLPWEFMFDSSEDSYVCLETPLVRHPQVARSKEPLSITPPLRILGMIALPDDQESLSAHTEQRRLDEALADLKAEGLVALRWVTGQTWRDLREAVRRDVRSGSRRGDCHVLHFIGHGGYDTRAQEGTLALTGEQGGTYWLGAGQLAMLLADHPSLRLAVLNACETGRADVLNPYSSVAGALMRKGIPAVLAMQYEVSENAALECAHAFYDALSRWLPIDVAVMEARQAMTLARPGTLEWGTPVLHMRSLDYDGHIFRLSGTSDESKVPREGTGIPPPVHRPDLADLYAEGLAAYFTDRWDAAVEAFRTVVAWDRDYRDAQAKLAQARHHQRLAALYDAGAASVAERDWDRAIEHLDAVVTTEADYKDAAALLELARKERIRAQLREEISDLHERGQWQAVVAAAERLRELDMADTAPDPEVEAMVCAARAALEEIAWEEELRRHYREALDHIEDRDWARALETLDAVQAIDPDYRDSALLVERVRSKASAAEPKEPPPRPTEPPARPAWLPARPTQPPSAPWTQFTVPHRVKAIAFSPGGERLATAMTLRTALVSDTGGGHRVTVRHGRLCATVRHVCFHPDGVRFATAAGNTARIWDARTGAQLMEVDQGAPVLALAFSPGGERLATAGHDAHVRIWNAKTGAELLRLRYSSSVHSLAFSPDGRRLVSGCADRTVWVCDTESATTLLKGKHGGSVFTVAFSSDGRRFAAGGSNGMASIRDAESGAPLLKVSHGAEVRALALSPDDRHLATIGGSTAQVWDTHTGREVFTLPHYNGSGIAFSRDGHRLATGGECTVRVYDFKELLQRD
ncbi:CHAT domain-containing protein [Streptomyces diastatochromogenes]|uniref:CHAT domain-containing protein n=1 Tax=Streptomyces diastatochromogenes TaxID=42236 RepID=UPI00142E1758|nr:CHAT domain-containing protein [Streptomyces diastatochromogenes]